MNNNNKKVDEIKDEKNCIFLFNFREAIEGSLFLYLEEPKSSNPNLLQYEYENLKVFDTQNDEDDTASQRSNSKKFQRLKSKRATDFEGYSGILDGTTPLI